MQSETIELGGNISLTGFSDLDKGQMVVLKKIIGNYARKFSDRSEKFEGLGITLSNSSETESNMYMVSAKLTDNGKTSSAEISDKNVFIAVDSVLKKIEG